MVGNEMKRRDFLKFLGLASLTPLIGHDSIPDLLPMPIKGIEHPLGTLILTEKNQFIYLRASTAIKAFSFVSIHAGEAVLLNGSPYSRIGVAGCNYNKGDYGWFCIDGHTTALCIEA